MLLQRDINTLGVSVIFIAKKNNQRKKRRFQDAIGGEIGKFC